MINECFPDHIKYANCKVKRSLKGFRHSCEFHFLLPALMLLISSRWTEIKYLQNLWQLYRFPIKKCSQRSREKLLKLLAFLFLGKSLPDLSHCQHRTHFMSTSKWKQNVIACQVNKFFTRVKNFRLVNWTICQLRDFESSFKSLEEESIRLLHFPRNPSRL